MIFAAMLKSISRADGSFKRMRFPWEWVVDGFLILLIMCSSLLYLNYIFEGNRVWCVPSYGPLELVETFEMLFVASSCKLQYKIALLIYFPYFSAASVLLLVMAHFFWKEIPWIQSKINLFGLLCIEVMSLDQVFYERDEGNRGMLRNFSFSQEQCNRVRHIQLKMFHLLLEKSSLSKYYIFKTTFTALLCVSFVVAISIILYTLSFLQSTFYCEIDSEFYNKYTNKFSCDVSSALPTYAIMLFHWLIFFIILIITLRALLNHYVHPYPLTTINSSELSAEFKSYPGYNDIMFMFALIHSNVYDGGLLLSNFIKVMLLKESDHMKNLGHMSSSYSLCYLGSTKTTQSDESADDTVSSNAPIGIDVDSEEDETLQFISADDLKAFYIDLLSKFSFVGTLQPVIVIDDCSPKQYNSWSLINCLMNLYHKIEPLYVVSDFSKLVEQIQNEIVQQKDYLLLYANCLRIMRYDKEPLSLKQWYNMISSMDQMVQFCYFVVVSAFCNIYRLKVTVITLKENEKNAIEIFQPYTAPNNEESNDNVSSNNNRNFYIAKAKHFYFALKRNVENNYCDSIFDKTFSNYTEKEKHTLRKLLYRYKRKIKAIAGSYNIKRRSTFKKRPNKTTSVFMSFEWNPYENNEI